MEKRNGMLYPMMVIAAISVILFSVVGIATMTGHIPSALSQKNEVTGDSKEIDKDTVAAKEAEMAKQDAIQQTEVGKAQAFKAASSEGGPVTEQQSTSGHHRTAMVCANCGVVESVHVRELKGHGTGLGVVGGALIGGVLGHQVGAGRGNDLATVAGAVGGGYAGNEIEKNTKKTTQYVIRVRMENNTYRTVTQSARPDVAAGDRVRIENGAIVARG